MDGAAPDRIAERIVAAVRRPSFLWFTGAAVLAGLIFWAFPGIDLWAAGLFWRPNGGFFLKDGAFARFFYESIRTLTPVLIGALIVMLAIAVVRRVRPFGLGVAAILYLILVFALGPGVLVNATLKDNWGRARPSQITEFGGARQFTPAFVVSDQCGHNCSFVAGHPAMVFGFFGLALLVRERRRRALAIAAVAAVGALAGLGRMMQGGHFLSDVVFAGVFVFAVAWLLEKLMLEPAVAAWLQDRLRLDPGTAAALRDHAARAAASARAATRPATLAAPPIGRAERRFVATILRALLLLGAAAYFWLDRPLAEAFRGLEGTPVHRFFEYVTQLGVSTGWLLGSFVVFALGWWAAERAPDEARRRRRADWSVRGLYVFACVAVPGLLTNLLKVLFGRSRPKLLFADGDFGFHFLRFHPDYWSFPSGHTTAAAGLAMAICLMRPRLWPLGLAFTLLVAASRFVLDRHYLSDTLFSAFLAVAAAIALQHIFTERGARIFPPPRAED
jgi:lipid A 4'-phosphatase